MRCSSCNKFVSTDGETEPEIDVEIAGDQVSGTARIVNNCADCSQELKEANFDIAETIPGFDEHKACAGELSVSVPYSGRTDRMHDKTRDGKQIKHARFMKHMFGAEATFKVECDTCEFEESIDWSDELPSSDMDEL